MGSVYPYNVKGRAKPLYRIVYRRPDHKQTSESGFTRKGDAERRLAEVEVSKHRGEYIAPADGKATISELGRKWLAGKESSLKASSYAPLETAWRLYVEPVWGDYPVSSIRHSDVQAWVSGIKKSPTVVIRAHGVLAGILDVAGRDRRVSANAARGVDLPRKQSSRERRYLTHSQLWAVANNAGRRRVLVLVLGYCGLRWGEAIGLRVSDLDFKRRRISITRNAVEVGGTIHEGTPKTHEARHVYVPATISELLESHCEGKAKDALVFPNLYGNFERKTYFDSKKSTWWANALNRAGAEKMTIHDLRHTAASLAVSAGANVKALQRMLGHASAAMTLDVYADLFDSDLEDVAGDLDQAISSQVVAGMLRPEAD